MTCGSVVEVHLWSSLPSTVERCVVRRQLLAVGQVLFGDLYRGGQIRLFARDHLPGNLRAGGGEADLDRRRVEQVAARRGDLDNLIVAAVVAGIPDAVCRSVVPFA